MDEDKRDEVNLCQNMLIDVCLYQRPVSFSGSNNHNFNFRFIFSLGKYELTVFFLLFVWAQMCVGLIHDFGVVACTLGLASGLSQFSLSLSSLAALFVVWVE